MRLLLKLVDGDTFPFRQEIDRMQRMLSLLRRTLTDLVMAIEGTIIMSDDLKEVLDNMFDAKVWQGWTDIGSRVLLNFQIIGS